MPETIPGENLLHAYATRLPYPATPDVADAVLRSITSTPRRTRTNPRLVWGALAAAAVAGSVAVVATTPVVAEWLRIDGSRITVLTPSSPDVTGTPWPPASEIDASAAPSSLESARREIGFAPGLPNGEEPREVFVVRYGEAQVAILRFGQFDLWEADIAGDFDGIYDKGIESPVQATDVSVGGYPAQWISGGPHVVQYVDAQGEPVSGSARTVLRNTLIWRTDFALYRIETGLGLEDAIAIAASLP